MFLFMTKNINKLISSICKIVLYIFIFLANIKTMNKIGLDEKYTIYKDTKDEIKLKLFVLEQDELIKKYKYVTDWSNNPESQLLFIDTLNIFGEPSYFSTSKTKGMARWNKTTFFYSNFARYMINDLKKESGDKGIVPKSFRETSIEKFFPIPKDREYEYKSIEIRDLPLVKISNQFTPKYLHMKVEFEMQLKFDSTIFSETLTYDPILEILTAQGPFFHDCLLQFYLAKKWSENPDKKIDTVKEEYKKMYPVILKSYRSLIQNKMEMTLNTLRNLESQLFLNSDKFEKVLVKENTKIIKKTKSEKTDEIKKDFDKIKTSRFDEKKIPEYNDKKYSFDKWVV